MTPQNKTLADVRAHFGDKTVLVVACASKRDGTAPLGLAFAVTPELLESLKTKQAQVGAIGAHSAQFPLDMDCLWLQRRLREGLTAAQVEDAIVPFWKPDVFVSGPNSQVIFVEEGDDDSGGVVSNDLYVSHLNQVLHAPESLKPKCYARDEATNIIFYSDYAGAAQVNLAEAQKGIYVDGL